MRRLGKRVNFIGKALEFIARGNKEEAFNSLAKALDISPDDVTLPA